MAIWQKSQKLNTVDDAVRPGLGTVGGDHITPGSVQGHNLNQNILPFDDRVKYYGGVNGGTWTLSVNAAGLYRFSTFARATTPGQQVAVTFKGPRIEVYGVLFENGGKIDCYIDGNLYNLGTIPTTNTFVPAIIPPGQQVPPTSNQIAALNDTTTTITVSDTSHFQPTNGAIRIGDEYIFYTSTDATNFLGCTRGAFGSVATTHVEGTPIYQVGPSVDTYSARRAYRRCIWVADNLGQGDHTLVIQVRSDKNASSGGTEIRVDSFTTGALVGGTTLNLQTEQIQIFTSQAMDASGNYLAGAPSNYINTKQLVGILGIVDDSHALTYQIDNAGNIWIHGAASTTYTNCYLTVVYAQETV